MKNLFKDILQDKTMIFTFYIDGAFIIGALAYLLISLKKLPPFVPIYNQLPWGEQRLGSEISLFIPILASVLILIVNLFTSAYIYKKIPLISRMLAAVSLLTGVLTFIFILKTIIVLT